ncbi:MAG: nicotinate-nucleotide--dimethylbenzimidazole phosphoribosyltransferase [Halobacteriota archaeon]
MGPDALAPVAIPPIDQAAIDTVRHRQSTLTKPPGSLGRLETIAAEIAGIQADPFPSVDPAAIVTAAADHGVAAAGVSAYPQSVTAAMLRTFADDSAAVNAIGGATDVETIVCDFGVIGDRPAGALDCRIGPGTDDMREGPAMSRSAAIDSIETGRSLVADRLPNAGCVGIGEMGIANSTAAAAITAVLTDADVAAVTGRGTGIDDERYAHKVDVIAESIETNAPDRGDPIDVLRCVGGYEIGGLVGVTIEAASRRIPVVVDGFIAGAAALLAVGLDERVGDYLLASHASVEPGHAVQLGALELEPLFDHGMRLGEGTGAALAIATYRSACAVHAEMATFEEAGIK